MAIARSYAYLPPEQKATPISAFLLVESPAIYCVYSHVLWVSVSHIVGILISVALCAEFAARKVSGRMCTDTQSDSCLGALVVGLYDIRGDNLLVSCPFRKW